MELRYPKASNKIPNKTLPPKAPGYVLHNVPGAGYALEAQDAGGTTALVSPEGDKPSPMTAAEYASKYSGKTVEDRAEPMFSTQVSARTPYDIYAEHGSHEMTQYVELPDNKELSRERNVWLNMSMMLDEKFGTYGDTFSQMRSTISRYDRHDIEHKSVKQMQCENLVMYMALQEQYQRNGMTGLSNDGFKGMDYYSPRGPVYRGLAIHSPEVISEYSGLGLSVVTDRDHDIKNSPPGVVTSQKYSSEGWRLEAPMINADGKYTIVSQDLEIQDNAAQFKTGIVERAKEDNAAQFKTGVMDKPKEDNAAQFKTGIPERAKEDNASKFKTGPDVQSDKPQYFRGRLVMKAGDGLIRIPLSEDQAKDERMRGIPSRIDKNSSEEDVAKFYGIEPSKASRMDRPLPRDYESVIAAAQAQQAETGMEF